MFCGARITPDRWLPFTVSSVFGHEGRWNCKGTCKACGAKTSLLGTLVVGTSTKPFISRAVRNADGRLFYFENGTVTMPCRGCGVGRRATRLAGKYNPGKECNAKCMGACGHACECKCSGKNHGASFSL